MQPVTKKAKFPFLSDRTSTKSTHSLTLVVFCCAFMSVNLPHEHFTGIMRSSTAQIVCSNCIWEWRYTSKVLFSSDCLPQMPLCSDWYEPRAYSMELYCIWLIYCQSNHRRVGDFTQQRTCWWWFQHKRFDHAYPVHVKRTLTVTNHRFCVSHGG